MTLRTSPNVFRNRRDTGQMFLAGRHDGMRAIYMERAKAAIGDTRSTLVRFAREAHHNMLRHLAAARGSK